MAVKKAKKMKKPGKKASPRLSQKQAPLPEEPLPAAPAPVPEKWSWGVVGAWAAAAFALLSLPRYFAMLPAWYPRVNPPVELLLFVSFAAMVFFLWKMGPEKEEGEIPRRMAWLVFAVLLGLTWQMRMDDAYRFPYSAWDDHFWTAKDIRNTIDYSNWRLLYPFDFRPPFFNDLAAVLWILFPSLKGIYIIRLATTVIDLFTVWIFYLLGKEAGGRRMGLILMAMGAFGKTFIEVSKYDQGCQSAILLACALILLFMFRLFKNPSLRHFVQLGLALGFADYTQTIVRPWIPSVVIGLLLWVVLSPERRPKSLSGWTLAAGWGGTWVLTFLFLNLPMIKNIPWLAFWSHPGPKWTVLLILAVCYLVVLAGGREKFLFGWATGTVLTALADLPLWLDPGYNSRSGEMGVWSPRFHLTTAEAIQGMISRMFSALPYLFGPNGDSAPHHFRPGEPFLDLFVPIFILLGLAVLFARPDWRKTAVAVLFLVGIVPVILSMEIVWPYLMGCIVPIYFFTALGANRLWLSVDKALGPRRAGWGTLLIMALGAWFFVSNVHWLQDWGNNRSADGLSGDVMREELADNLIYLMPAPTVPFGDNIQDQISEGRDVHRGEATNPICLAPGEKTKDLAVMIGSWDTALDEQLKKEFPGAAWHQRSKQDGWTLRWVAVPCDQIPESPANLIYIKRVPASFWDRQFYGRYGMTRGIILREDRTEHWNEQLPPFATAECSALVRGTWVVSTPGQYRLTLNTSNVTWLFLDGKKVLEASPRDPKPEKSVTLNLAAGSHSVEEKTGFSYQNQFPPVTVHSESEGWDKPLDELSGGTSAPAAPAGK